MFVDATVGGVEEGGFEGGSDVVDEVSIGVDERCDRGGFVIVNGEVVGIGWDVEEVFGRGDRSCRVESCGVEEGDESGLRICW